MKPLKEKFKTCFFNNIFIDLTFFGITFININLLLDQNSSFSFQLLGLSEEEFSLFYFSIGNHYKSFSETKLIILTKYIIDK